MNGVGALWPALLPSARYGDDSICAVSAKGVTIRFADGRDLLCATSGLWNCSLGYGNEAIAEACADALREASYLSVFRYENDYARRAAEALVALAGADHYGRVIFSTSGGAAIDLVIKLVRLYQLVRGEGGRRLVVRLRNSFHGLTYGSFGLTGEPLGQQIYSVDQRFVRHVSPNSVEELNALVEREGRSIAAFVVEPVLGTGTVELEEPFLRELFRHRSEHGFLVVADEVATGFGRTGSMFASCNWPAKPDGLVLSKALTNGTCGAAALVVSRDVSEMMANSEAVLAHGETQAGTPPTCAAICATLGEFDRLDAVERGRRISDYLDRELDSLEHRLPIEARTVGKGLFRTLSLVLDSGEPLPQSNVAALVESVREAGAVVHPGLNGAQLVPALIYSETNATDLVTILETGIRSFCDSFSRSK